MAIVQISRIQHRTGRNEDLPQLAEGEFGFATDQRRLYIGNDAIQYPASSGTTTQTEILTEFSDISFSQIEGSQGLEFNISQPLTEGQVLVVEANTAAGISPTYNVVNRGGVSGYSGTGNIHLGDINNVKILGGFNSWVLTTKGNGDLIWAPSGITISDITNIQFDTGSANTTLITTNDAHNIMLGRLVTITDAQGLLDLGSRIGNVDSSETSNVVTCTSIDSFGEISEGDYLATSSDLIIGIIETIDAANSKFVLSSTS